MTLPFPGFLKTYIATLRKWHCDQNWPRLIAKIRWRFLNDCVKDLVEQADNSVHVRNDCDKPQRLVNKTGSFFSSGALPASADFKQKGKQVWRNRWIQCSR